ncbi:MAG TPA: FmdB family zinc ribbon protein [Acidimicrobiales bacterium]|nr:FmdB family zinc ribbon protein [Acidimicrobiales bacterium]
MPTYEYACTSCGHHTEAVQSFSDDPLTTCPDCGGPLRKVYGAVGIVLKGSGFYKTDSRSTNGSSKPSADKGSGDKGSDGGGSGGSDKGSGASKAESGSSTGAGAAKEGSKPEGAKAAAAG